MIIFFSSFPPPHTGQTIGNKLVYNYLKNQFNIIKINTSSRRRIIIKSSNWLISFFNLIKQCRCKNVHTLYFIPGSSIKSLFRDIITIIIGSYYKLKIIAHIRCGDLDRLFKNNIIGFLSKYFYSKIDTIIFLSDNLLSKSEKFLSKKTKRIVIPNGIDDSVTIDRNKFIEIKNKRKIDGKIKILYLSNMIKSKGYLSVLDLLKMNDNKLEIHFIGKFFNQRQEKKFLKQIQNNKNVFFHGLIKDRSEISKHLQKSHIFILPTFYPNEALPRSIIEAMCNGLPIISTKHAGIPSQVKDNYNGFLLNPDYKTIDIYNFIEKILNNYEFYSKNSRDLFENTFNNEIISKKTINVFR